MLDRVAPRPEEEEELAPLLLPEEEAEEEAPKESPVVGMFIKFKLVEEAGSFWRALIADSPASSSSELTFYKAACDCR